MGGERGKASAHPKVSYRVCGCRAWTAFRTGGCSHALPPCMAALLTFGADRIRLWNMENVVPLMDAREITLARRGIYKLRAARAVISN